MWIKIYKKELPAWIKRNQNLSKFVETSGPLTSYKSVLEIYLANKMGTFPKSSLEMAPKNTKMGNQNPWQVKDPGLFEAHSLLRGGSDISRDFKTAIGQYYVSSLFSF